MCKCPCHNAFRPMQETADESAELKQALKHDPATPELRAAANSLEGHEAYFECVDGLDTATPGSWAAEQMA